MAPLGLTATRASQLRLGWITFTNMNTKQLIELGVPETALAEAGAFIVALRESGGAMARLPEEMAAIVAQPEAFLGDPLRAALARELYEPSFSMREVPAPWRQWGEGLDAAAVAQLANACTLPVSVAGALMPPPSLCKAPGGARLSAPFGRFRSPFRRLTLLESAPRRCRSERLHQPNMSLQG